MVDGMERGIQNVAIIADESAVSDSDIHIAENLDSGVQEHSISDINLSCAGCYESDLIRYSTENYIVAEQDTALIREEGALSSPPASFSMFDAESREECLAI